MLATRILPALLLALAVSVQAQVPDADAALRHQSEQWLSIAPHLPSSANGSPAELQTAGDVLRARRLPEDALDYYRFALSRGGSPTILINRIGVTELELREPLAARAAFKQALTIDKKNAEGWNNLGAAEYMLGEHKAALNDYRKAVKLDKAVAVFHANLGTALFEQKDFEGARAHFSTALKLDPLVFQHSGRAGVQAHILSASDRGRFCFEMAQLSAANHNDDAVLLWLARATEAGFDVKTKLEDSRELEAYKHDARVALLLANAKSMHSPQLAAAPVPALPADSVVHN